MGVEGFQVGASGPANYERYVAAFMTPFAEAAVVHSGVRPGSAVLDVACGTGFVTRRLQSAVAPNGRVVGIDVNPHMLTEAAARCPEGIEWIESSAISIPLPDREFDAVACQQGVQFFSDRSVAFAEMHRVLKPGGRVVATVWAPLDSNPYQRAQHAALSAVAAPPDGIVQAVPDDGDRMLVDAASAAGFDDLEVLRIEIVATLPRLDGFIPGGLAATPWGATYASLDDAAQGRVRSVIIDALQPYVNPDGSAGVPFASHLLIATKSTTA